MHSYRSLFALTAFHFRSLIRNRIAFFFNLILPVLLVGLFGAMYGQTETAARYPVGLVDQDGGPVAQTLRQTLDTSGLFEIRTGNESDLLALLQKGKLRAVVLLPEGVSSQVPATVTIRWDRSSQTSGAAMTTLQSLIGRQNALMTGAQPLLVARVEELPAVEGRNVFDFLLPGELVYALLAAGLMSVCIGLATARHSGSLRHLFSTPLSISVWTASHIAANLVMAFLQLAVLYGGAILMFKVAPPANLTGTVVLLVISALACLSMGMAIGTFARNADMAFPIGMIVYMALAFLGGSMMPLDGAPAIVTNLMKLTPSYYMTDALKLVMMQGKSLAMVLPHIGVLAAITVVLIGLSAWRIRKQFLAA